MPLKKSAGNMYPWVTHTWSVLAGECPHLCPYCYVRAMGKRFPNLRARYTGPVRLVPSELDFALGAGRTIFVEHMSDLFAATVPSAIILRVLDHCRSWPDNTYVFQTKNPWRYYEFLGCAMPLKIILGTTIETNRNTWELNIGLAPKPSSRASAMLNIRGTRFITIEPILDFDTDVLVRWILRIRPAFVNIGADSKGSQLSEPSAEKVRSRIKALQESAIEIREKHNLGRWLQTQPLS